MLRPGIEQPHFRPFGHEIQIDQRVATAGFDVAMCAVGVQVRTRPAIEAVSSVEGIDEPPVFVRPLDQPGNVNDTRGQRR